MKITDNPNYENIIDFMRADLESDMSYTKIINTVKDKMESEGRDFWKEYEEWRKKN